MPRVRIVIVNYRTADLTIDCLRSLAHDIPRLGDARVVVTDNLSGDDSVARLSAAVQQNAWNTWCTLMPLPRNGGFAYGNNQAIAPFLAETPAVDYVLLLNPDTVVRPNAIAALVDFMEKTPRAGIVGSRLEDPDGTPQISAFRFHNTRSELLGAVRLGLLTKAVGPYEVAAPLSHAPCPADWVAGASMLVRRTVFDTVGLLDEKYFMYFEEVDFCLRAARAGFPTWYEPASRVVHLVGQASGVTDPKKRKRRPTYWFDSRRRYVVKNFGRFSALLWDTLVPLGLASWQVRRVLQRKPNTDPPHFIGDHVRNSVFVKGFGL